MQFRVAFYKIRIMKIMITGSTGFIGSHLVERLSNVGEVYALVRDKKRAGHFPAGVRIINGDLFQSETWPEDTEYLIHLAAVTKVARKAEFLEINHRGTLALLEKCRRLPVLRRIVFLSSLAAAGPSSCKRGLREEEEPRPVSRYGMSKLLAEKAVIEFSPVPFVIIRPPIVFGPGDFDMLTALKTSRGRLVPVVSGDKGRYSIIHVRDLVRVIELCLQADCENEIIHAAHPEPVEWRSFIAEAGRILGREKTRFLPVPVSLISLAALGADLFNRLLGRKAIFNLDKAREMRFSCWLCDTKKMNRLLGFSPEKPVFADLVETIDWYRRQGLL